jgi:hypothetical protein
MLTVDDVHLAYARAMHEIQRFEWATLVGLGLVKVARELKSGDPSEKLGPLVTYVEEEIGKLQPRERTLASMFNNLSDSVRKRNTAFDSILRKANDDRNRMAHYFLLTVELKNSAGCTRAIADLSSTEDRFRKRYADTKRVIGEALRRVGISKSDVEQIHHLIDGLYLEPRG